MLKTRTFCSLTALLALAHAALAAPLYHTLDSGAAGFLPLNAASWAWSATAGVNGTGALVNTRTNAASYTYATLPVTLRPQSAFRFSAWVKGNAIAGPGVGSGLALQHSRAATWLSGDEPMSWIKGSPPGWQRVEGYGYANPAETPNRADLAFFLKPNMTGTTTYDNIRLEELGNVPAFNNNFDAGLSGVELQSVEWSRDATGGRNGTAGLLLNRTSATSNAAAVFYVPSTGLDFTIPYHFAVWVRGENVQGTGMGGYIDAEYSKPGTWLGWDDSTTGSGNGTTAWKRIEGIATPLRGTASIQLDLFLSYGMTGKVWFDDLELQPLVTTGSLASFPAILPASAQAVSLDNPNFANDLRSWSYSQIPSGFTHASGEGTGGSGGIKLTKPNSVPWIYAYQAITLQPGYVYTISVDIKTSGLAGSGEGALVGIDHSGANSEWLAGESSPGVKTANGNWTTVSTTTYARSGEIGAAVYFGLSSGFSGTVWFDNIRVTASSIRPLQASMLTPGNRTLTESNGQFTLAVHAPELAGYDSRLAKLLVRRSGVAIAERDYLLRDNRIYADVGQLPEGSYELDLSIIDLHEKVIVGTCMMPLNVVSSTRSIPSNYSAIDNYARLQVGGAPYMPVGMYASGDLQKTDLDAIAATNAFNMLAAYYAPILKFAGSTQGDIASVNEVLSYARTKNIKVLFGLHCLLPEARGWLMDAPTILGFPNTQRNWTPTSTDAENEALVDLAVSSFKSHPALLGWYTQDEQAPSRIPYLSNRRQLINQMDPFHVVAGATLAGVDFPAYTSTWDIGMTNFYPVNTGLSDANAKEFLKSNETMADSMRLNPGSSLSWGITQCHNTGFYTSPTTALRFPTVIEMRAMSLAQAIYGCKGFLFYAYTELKLNSTPATLSQRLGNVAAAAATLRLFEPYLMSSQPPPVQPVLTISGGRVLVRSFKHNNGSTGVALSGFSDPNAVITMPAGTPQLRSLYNVTTYQGNQQYRFIGTGTQADLLIP
jgi:hypothetical protein